MFFSFRRTPPPPAFDPAALMAELQILRQQGKLIMSALDNLKTAVTAQTTVDQSALTLIEGIASQLSTMAASNNDAALQALADELTASTTPLASAVAANTPAAPAPAATATTGAASAA